MERLRVSRLGGEGPRTRPDRLGGGKACSSRRDRRCLCRRQIRHTIPEPKSQRGNRQRRGSKGGRPTSFDTRAYVFQGTVTVAATRLWLRGQIHCPHAGR
ncbi:hypothetical protein GTW67_28090 [Streptomyces sp. SID5910]|nr:hypothetical protein [Streptomyces sp. SID5910]